VRLRICQTQAGKRMFHCHILEHEDQGMMAVLDVQA
jgi:bilirubin oxidase